jgi:excisionase family DNA binding protein
VYLTRREAAAYLNISLSTLDAWAAAGRVVFYRAKAPGVKLPMVRYHQRDLDAVLERIEGPTADD